MSYVNYKDLEEVLSEYYAGRLDECDRFIHRISGDLRDLHPTNTLFGLCDNDLICRCVESLDKVYQWVLYCLKSPFTDDECFLVVRSYFQGTGGGNFQDWLGQMEAIAMSQLEKLILEQI